MSIRLRFPPHGDNAGRTGGRAKVAFAGALVACVMSAPAAADSPYLASIHRHAMLTSTTTPNGDGNPYAVVVAPVSAGKIHQGDVLVTNFNNVSNLQGTGGTIVDYNPATKQTTLFASIPQHLPQCPGGVGLGTAMTMLKSGWVIVGSTPSTDGTTKTLGKGCLIVLDPNGKVVTTWADPNIDDPWGNMAVLDHGTTATLFVSMSGFGVPPLDVLDPKSGYPVTVNKATVLRITLSIPEGKPPVITNETVVANGFGQRADRDAFLIGPTGLALSPNDILYVSDALGNRIAAIDNASTRTASAGTGRTVVQGGLLRRPLAMIMAPNGNLLITNANNGQVVEVDPQTGKDLAAQWVDADEAQSPPGNHDLFGLAITTDGKGFYYVEDDVNTLMEAK
ncbi:MAG: hypothetical protein M0T84_18600 [Betaproteobacteria bacterium]|nr:hypothetical protein [Betaproteobacteria bacterium]